MSVNKVILIGRAGKDPDVRTLDGGAKVASLSFVTKWNPGAGTYRMA